MGTFMILALTMTSQDSSAGHVRTTESKIVRLIDTGISASATFRGLIATLNESDVIVYIQPKRTRQALGGYLAHNIVAQGQYRYLRIAVEIAGAERRLVPLLAHELQHAVEVAQTPDARDADSLERMFSRLATKFGCGGTTCFETQAAKNVEHIVREELAALRLGASTRLRAEQLPSRHETSSCVTCMGVRAGADKDDKIPRRDRPRGLDYRMAGTR